MATVELNMEVIAYLEDEGVAVDNSLNVENDGQPAIIPFDELFDDLINAVDLDTKEDRDYVERIATQLADLSKDLFCRIG